MEKNITDAITHPYHCFFYSPIIILSYYESSNQENESNYISLYEVK